MSFPLQRIDRLARREGVSFQEAARWCARKGVRLKRERRAARLRADPMKVRWDLKEALS